MWFWNRYLDLLSLISYLLSLISYLLSLISYLLSLISYLLSLISYLFSLLSSLFSLLFSSLLFSSLLFSSLLFSSLLFSSLLFSSLLSSLFSLLSSLFSSLFSLSPSLSINLSLNQTSFPSSSLSSFSPPSPGISIAANKVNGIRAALCHDHYTALMCREHNDANVLCMGARVSGGEIIKEMVVTYLETPFEGGKHAKRVAKIHALE